MDKTCKNQKATELGFCRGNKGARVVTWLQKYVIPAAIC